MKQILLSHIRNRNFLIGIFLLLNQIAFAQSTNLALNKPATASSTENSTYAASLAFDGITSTKWSSATISKASLYVDLGSTYDIKKVILKWGDGKFASAFDIEVSDNAVDWTKIYSTAVNTEAVTNTIPDLWGIGRYVRFSGRGRGAGDRYRLAEFEVYGVVPIPTTPAQQTSINVINGRLVGKWTSAVVNQDTINNYINTQLSNGSWSDIQYSRVDTFFAQSHLVRLKAMAYAYRNSTNPLYNNASLLTHIINGFEYWYNVKPTTTVWYDQDIDAPQDYMVALILLKGKISSAQLLKYSAYLVDRTAQYRGEGKNLTWISNITIYKGCIEDSYRLVDIGFRAVSSPLVIVTGKDDDGIKIDNSFHQHGAQLYSAGYGLSIMSDFTDAIELASGTEFINSFSNDRRRILSNVLLKGHQRLGYRNAMDFGAMGRNISRPSVNNYTNVSASLLDQMIAGDPDSTFEYQAWKNNLSGGAYPTRYLGNYHFWKSDIMTHHGANYYMSAKIISLRTRGTESINGENIKGYNLPFGSTQFLTQGDEYMNLFPVWDWTRVPGATAENNQAATALNSYVDGTNVFGGGVSDAENGVLAYEHDYNGVKAKKSYFFLGADALLCLGTGITASKSNNIVTSINQCYASGNVTINNGTSTSTFTGTSQMFNDIKWVHHDNIGYIFPNAGYMAIEKKRQEGHWSDINTLDGTTALQYTTVFSLWINHSSTPSNRSYYYIVMPDKSLSDFQTAVNNHGFTVIKNDSNQQAVVRNDSQKKYAIIFYNPGTVDMGDGLTVTSNQKAIIILKKYSSDYKISIADPIYSQSGITVTINKNLSGTNAVYSGGNTTINFALPGGDLTGKTITGFYKINSSSFTTMSAQQTVVPTEPGTDANDLSKSISIYPNPTSSIIYVKGIDEAKKLEVYDLSGHRYKAAFGTSIDVSSLTPGNNYFLRIHTNGTVVSKQFIKQ
jgi:chondroitin AC lyase